MRIDTAAAEKLPSSTRTLVASPRPRLKPISTERKVRTAVTLTPLSSTAWLLIGIVSSMASMQARMAAWPPIALLMLASLALGMP